MTQVLVAFGTRPEYIKLAPLVIELRNREVSVQFACSNQHTTLLGDIFEVFNIYPDSNYGNIGTSKQSTDILPAFIEASSEFLDENDFDLVVVHGDTITSVAMGISAFYKSIPVAHVEAGLRSGDLSSPWPEEGNRRIIDGISTLLFPPTTTAAENLLSERNGIQSSVYGNTGIDALRLVLQKPGFSDTALELLNTLELTECHYGLITLHRRENFGPSHIRILQSIRSLADEGHNFVFPLHPNPLINYPAKEILSDHKRIRLIDPLRYDKFLALMSSASFLLTDSGGIQEEATALGIPIIVARENTERPEILHGNSAWLVGSDNELITNLARTLMQNTFSPRIRNTITNFVFGNGYSSSLIADDLLLATPRKSI